MPVVVNADLKNLAEDFTRKISLFCCINALNVEGLLSWSGVDDVEVRTIKLPCSGMVKDVFLLRAFEAGSDAVVVLVCPDGECRYVDGNKRAVNRVQRVKHLLDEIGLDGRRLSIFHIPREDQAAAGRIVQQTVSDLRALGPNPAAPKRQTAPAFTCEPGAGP
jgi:coenzyme F420-reducing hydrogenase delta subunit